SPNSTATASSIHRTDSTSDLRDGKAPRHSRSSANPAAQSAASRHQSNASCPCPSLVSSVSEPPTPRIPISNSPPVPLSLMHYKVKGHRDKKGRLRGSAKGVRR